MTKLHINYSDIIKKLLQQRRVVGLLQFELKEENNFAKWYSLTENLVIKAFGPKSNQIEQLQALYNDMRSGGDWQPERKIIAKEAKEKLKNLISVFVEELKLDASPAKAYPNKGTNNVLIANQTVNISLSISQVIEKIKENEPDPARAREAETKLNELNQELQQKSPTWSKIKGILEWLLNFGRDAFLAVLPLILERYKNQ